MFAEGCGAWQVVLDIHFASVATYGKTSLGLTWIGLEQTALTRIRRRVTGSRQSADRVTPTCITTDFDRLVKCSWEIAFASCSQILRLLDADVSVATGACGDRDSCAGWRLVAFPNLREVDEIEDQDEHVRGSCLGHRLCSGDSSPKDSGLVMFDALASDA
jgi:hypothetical protein